jgi:hypothetical protein
MKGIIKVKGPLGRSEQIGAVDVKRREGPEVEVAPVKVTVEVQVEKAGTRPEGTRQAGKVGRPEGPIRYISEALAQEVVDRIEEEKDSILIVADALHTLKASVAVLQALTGMYEMDGVMVCSDRPPEMVRRLLRRNGTRDDLIHFVGLRGGHGTHGGTGVIVPGADSTCPFFDLEALMEVIEEGLQSKAVRSGGEDHFVMFDDVAAFRYYHTDAPLKRFFEEIGRELEEHGVLLVALVAKEGASIFPRVLGSTFKARLNVKREWLL